jgi:ABC-type branched-subunit amino acid transport system ATPase component
MALLSIDSLRVGYVRGVDILQGISLHAEQGRITGIIGPNGAGKSTLLKSVFGFLPAHAGSIRLRGRELRELLPAEIKRLDISYVPQGINTFAQLTVRENLQMGCWTFRHDHARIREGMAEIFELFPVLHRKQHDRATYLSGGEAKMLSIAKELISRPTLLLVDEPSAGLAPRFTDQVYEFLLRRRDAGLTILLVDQNIRKCLEVSQYLYMLEMGQVKLEGEREVFAGQIREIVRDSLLGAGAGP